MSTTHRCSIKGCTAQVRRSQLMCRDHWNMVPSPLRSPLYEAWDDGNGYGTPKHAAAMHACTEAVEAKIAAKAS